MKPESENVAYEFTQTVVPSCHARGQRFVTVDSAVADSNMFKPAFRYTSSYQCSHGSSFCSSISLPGANCVAMIVLLSNFPFTAVYMCFGRLISTGFQERSDGTVEQTIFYLCAIYLVFASCDPATPLARWRMLALEFVVTYIFWPILPMIILLFVVIGIVFGILYIIFVLPFQACGICDSSSPTESPAAAEPTVAHPAPAANSVQQAPAAAEAAQI